MKSDAGKPSLTAGLLLPPHLGQAAASRPLAISWQGSAALVSIFLEDDSLAANAPRRQSLAAELLAHEPLLALWLATHAAGAGQPSPPTGFFQAADLLFTRGVRQALAQLDDDGQVGPGLAAFCTGEFAQLCVAAVGISQLAQHRAQVQWPAFAEAAGWLGLVAFIDLPQPDATAPPAAAVALSIGNSAAQRILATFKPEIASALSELTSQAQRDWHAAVHGELTAGELQRWPPVDLMRQAARIAWRWSSDCHEAGAILPALLKRLDRLDMLEYDFANQLQIEKLASLRRLAYGASHEINNPLANISTRAQTLLREIEHPDQRRRLAAIHTQAMRAHEMISDLMLFARPPEMRLQPLELSALTAKVFEQYRPIAEDQQTTMLWQPGELALPVNADPDQVSVAIGAVLRNSLEALGRSGNVVVRAQLVVQAPLVSDRANAAMSGSSPVQYPVAQIIVTDDGPGISPAEIAHIFDPFHSGREAGRGLGFGLSKAWRIFEQHGGAVTVESQPGRGTSFFLSLPVAGESR